MEAIHEITEQILLISAHTFIDQTNQLTLMLAQPRLVFSQRKNELK